jgi:hypothetical protein
MTFLVLSNDRIGLEKERSGKRPDAGTWTTPEAGVRF